MKGKNFDLILRDLLLSFSKKDNGKNDITVRTMKEEKELPHSELTSAILGCCFDVMRELGPGFLEGR